MADFFRVQFGIVSRGDGHCAAKRSAYQACGRAVDHKGRTFDFSRKRKEHVCTVMLAPDGAPEWARKQASLWRRAAEAEKRIDAQEARIVDFSMPRAIPPRLWEACIRHVYAPFIARGMVFQIDIHDIAASDGGRNINIHGLATLRPIDGDGFAKRKDRSWNDLFRERGGRNVREMFAERLTAFCQEHAIAYEGDARSNQVRDLPDPEPQLPKWNFEAFTRTQQMSEALMALHHHRNRRREWDVAKAEEIEAAVDLVHLETLRCGQRERRITSPYSGRAISTPDRRAAILRAWYQGSWIDSSTIPVIASVRLDKVRTLLWINLVDGSILIDHGDTIRLRGRLTWAAAQETAAAAERHGWVSVRVQGDQSYRDAVAVACMLRGIRVENHCLSVKARADLERRRSEQPTHSEYSNDQKYDEAGRKWARGVPAPPETTLARSSSDIHLALKKRTAVVNRSSIEPSDAGTTAPTYKPSFRRRVPL